MKFGEFLFGMFLAAVVLAIGLAATLVASYFWYR
jgi:hypothetical protein